MVRVGLFLGHVWIILLSDLLDCGVIHCNIDVYLSRGQRHYYLIDNNNNIDFIPIIIINIHK